MIGCVGGSGRVGVVKRKGGLFGWVVGFGVVGFRVVVGCEGGRGEVGDVLCVVLVLGVG